MAGTTTEAAAAAALTAGAWPAELALDCAGRGQRANRGWRMWIWRPTQGSAPSTSAWGGGGGDVEEEKWEEEEERDCGSISTKIEGFLQNIWYLPDLDRATARSDGREKRATWPRSPRTFCCANRTKKIA